MVVQSKSPKVLYLQYFDGFPLCERMRHIPSLSVPLYAGSITQFEQTSLIPEEICTLSREAIHAKKSSPDLDRRHALVQQSLEFP